MLEEVVRDLPGFLSAGQRAEAKVIADRDEVSAWLEKVWDWSNRARSLSEAISGIWYEVSPSLRTQALFMAGDWMEGGYLAMRAIDRLGDSLDEPAFRLTRSHLMEYMQSVLALTREIDALAAGDRRRKAIANGSPEFQARIQKAYEIGKREEAEGLGTTYSADEFRRRFT